ncbi:MAG: hypothetical protein ACFCU4_08755 [Puniceicoccaceae bacterium]
MFLNLVRIAILGCILSAGINFSQRAFNPTPSSRLSGLKIESAGAATYFQFLGGLRTVAADIAWLRSVQSWSQGYISRIESDIRLAIALRPENLYFWIDGTNGITYDIPAMKIVALGLEKGRPPPPSVETAIRKEYAHKGLDILRAALANFPDEPEILIAIGRIYLGPLDEPLQAFHYFRQAALQDRFSAGNIAIQILVSAREIPRAIEFIDEWVPVFEQPQNIARLPMILAWRSELLENID